MMPSRPRRGSIRRRAVAALAGPVLLWCATATAQARQMPQLWPLPVAAEPNLPIYNPASKSYFELRDDNAPPGTWEKARGLAARLSYKGARGRLAVVDSEATHLFLRRNFTIKEETWIGLRYWCAFRKLQWVTGKLHSREGFNIWANQWYRLEETMCGQGVTIGPRAYMPVYYLPRGFRWQACGASKWFTHYFVEYPTGKE
jgi:hypothetical protein